MEPMNARVEPSWAERGIGRECRGEGQEGGREKARRRRSAREGERQREGKGAALLSQGVRQTGGRQGQLV